MGALSRGRGSDARATICDRSAVGELLKASYAYDPFKGVKTSSTWKQNVSGNWSTERSESYSYAQDIEWLATVTTNDILGNRLTRSGGTTSCTWDLVNRMSSFTSGGVTRTYEYRADGMRMKKILASSTVDYFYDGQMPIEKRITAGTTVTSVQNAIGARGIDLITKSVSVSGGNPTVTKAYPIYDGHGNMVGTVSSSGTLADRRLYGPLLAQRVMTGFYFSIKINHEYCHCSSDTRVNIFCSGEFYCKTTLVKICRCRL